MSRARASLGQVVAPSGPILFYDGTCGLCHRAVRWTLRHDRAGEFRFAPLQGSTYAALPDPGKPMDCSAMAVHDGSALHVGADAVLVILRRCGGPWRLLAAALRCAPRPVRAACYAFVARHRFGWFGRVDACELPAPGARGRLLP